MIAIGLMSFKKIQNCKNESMTTEGQTDVPTRIVLLIYVYYLVLLHLSFFEKEFKTAIFLGNIQFGPNLQIPYNTFIT